MTQKKTAPPPKSSPNLLYGFIGIVVAAGLAFFVWPSGNASESASGIPSAQSRAASTRAKRPLPPLPKVDFAPDRAPEVLQAAYEFAADHPDVISYVPCFCGCEREGHVSNHSCFVSSRDAEGNVSWDTHGMGCGICVDVATETARMYNAGASLRDIRIGIERKYNGLYGTKTPTPPVPEP